MLKLNFHSTKERQPKIGQDIIYFKTSYGFGMEGFELKYGTVEGYYNEYIDAEESGMYFGATRYGKKPLDYRNAAGEQVTYKLMLQVGSQPIDSINYWTTEDKYWMAFDKAEIKEK